MKAWWNFVFQALLKLLLQVFGEVRVQDHILVEHVRSVPSPGVSASSAIAFACARTASGDWHDCESLRRHKNSGKVDTVVAQHPCAPQVPCCGVSSHKGEYCATQVEPSRDKSSPEVCACGQSYVRAIELWAMSKLV